MTTPTLSSQEEKDMLYAAHSGDDEAFNRLISYYEPEIRKIACKYFLQRADYDDLVQDGRIAIYKAVQSYKLDSNIPFRHFLRMVIKRKLIDSLRAHNRQKHLYFNAAFSLNNSLSEDQDETFLNAMSNMDDPETTIIALDEARNLVQELTQELSQLERLVFHYHFIAGYRQREVTERFGLTPKSLDNAIQRIRRKTMQYRSRQAG